MPNLNRRQSAVSEVAAADPEEALAHFSAMLRFEADCWDVHDAMTNGPQDFVLVDVRGPAVFENEHIPGAVNLPYGRMVERNLAEYPDDTLFVIYCAGPHCNATEKAAVRLAKLGRPFKKMIGGVEGWRDEGFDIVTTP
ncbi:MAG: rhodanese-like domain-containing protein [Actinomycetota bacterium]|nr:rhodanese-like domain-containing protein [Actinomycetota bacterium]